MIGRNVDLDLLSLFPQMGARIMEGLRDRASFSSSKMEERESERSPAQGGRRGVFIPPKKIEPLGKNQGRIIRPKLGPDNPAPPENLASGTKPGKYPAKSPAPVQSCFASSP